MVALILSACTKKDEAYFLTHPQMLQKQVAACSSLDYQNTGCHQWIALARKINKMALSLSVAPQRFGRDILQLQQQIAEIKASAIQAQAGAALEIQKQLEQKEHELLLRMAVVRWLESPGRAL